MNQNIKIKLMEKAKNLLLSSSLILTSLGGDLVAQSTYKPIKLNARDGQGYLVMNQPTTPYQCWRFQFYERTGKPTPLYSDGIIPLDNISVCGKDYVQVPTAYRFDRKRDIVVSVYGVAKTGETKVADKFSIGNYQGPARQIQNPNYGISRYGAVCDGNYSPTTEGYALQFTCYEEANASNPNGLGTYYLQMESPARELINGNIVIPYYGFYTPAQANQWIVNRYPGFTLTNYNGTEISQEFNTNQLNSGVYIFDPNGNPITGPYYMIAKDFGPYSKIAPYSFIPSSSFTSTGPLSGIQDYMYLMNNRLTYLATPGTIDYVNGLQSFLTNTNGYHHLACYGNNMSFTGANQGEYTSPCDINPNFSQLMDANTEIWDYIQVLNGCNNNISNTNPNLYEDLAAAELTSVVGGTTPIWSFHGGTPQIGEKIAIKTGLYNLSYLTKNGEYKSFIVEAKTNCVLTSQIKDFVTVNIFPVPIIGNTFSINLETPADETFTYELWDNNGNKIHTQIISLTSTSGTPFTIKVATRTDIPVGVTLINRFIFSDGSVKTLNTIKQ